MEETSDSASSSRSFDHEETYLHTLSGESTLVTTSREHSLDDVSTSHKGHGQELIDTKIFSDENASGYPPALDEDEPSSADTDALLSVDRSGLQHGPQIPPATQKSVGWSDLPKKGQLAVLTLARLSEPLAERSLAAYLFYQLRSFNPDLSDSTISAQGGLLTAAFAGAQLFTAVWWGRIADSPSVGRKNVILIGLIGSCIATLGVGFSKSFAAAMTWRIVAGALNGNVGVMRTMISEMIPNRKFQSRAFLLLPMCFNIGVIIGPILGGFLADPITSFPAAFGPGSSIGGKEGVAWMLKFPYALPNILSASLIFTAVIGIILGLDETHHIRKHRKDWGRRMAQYMAVRIFRQPRSLGYHRVDADETELQTGIGLPSPSEDQVEDGHHEVRQLSKTSSTNIDHQRRDRLGFCGIMTSNVALTLTSHFLLALHISTFNALIFLFLPNPPSPSNPSSFSLRFSGGLGLSTEKVGMATAILGVIGFPFQIVAYPWINTKLGTLRSYKWFLPFSALAYTAIPFLALLYNQSSLLWSCLTLVLAAQVLGRTFALPSTVILINNSSPSPAVLGTIHGIAQSVSSAARMLGPTVGGWGLGLGLRYNCVGAVWWAMAAVVGLNWTLLWMIWEGNGQGGKAET